MGESGAESLRCGARGADGFIEDGLGVDGLRCTHLGRPGAPVTALEY